MNRNGLNQGTSGNISVRHEGRMLITPTATSYEAMRPDMLASMPIDDSAVAVFDGPLRPSSEWRFHRDILRERPEIQAVVHAHPTFATTLSIGRLSIPACHYMIAAFGGNDVRCSDFAVYGTAALSTHALKALEGRTACLLANHGSIALGADLDKAMWRAVELETIARQYFYSLQLKDGPVILGDAEIEETLRSFGAYGLQAKPAA